MNIARYQCVKYCLTLNHHSFPQKYFSHLGICLDSIKVFIYLSWSCLGYDFNYMLERLKSVLLILDEQFGALTNTEIGKHENGIGKGE